MKTKWIFLVILCVAIGYGSNLLYYHLTDGFWVSNIASDLPYDSRWETRPLTPTEMSTMKTILSQKYTYLGKGCQAYVFQSADGQYVLKFFKYQRYRIKPWVEWFTFIPAVTRHKQERLEHKKAKLERFYTGWEVAFDELQQETGLMYVHLNKTEDLKHTLTIADKLGFEHAVDLDQIEFLLQKKAVMFTDEINRMMGSGNEDEAKDLIFSFIGMLLTEYQRGLADGDHAIMQNTGVIDGHPIHIDVGQFRRDPSMKNHEVWKQDLFNKTYKFNIWLNSHYPTLAEPFQKVVSDLIGPDMPNLKPQLINY